MAHNRLLKPLQPQTWSYQAECNMQLHISDRGRSFTRAIKLQVHLAS